MFRLLVCLPLLIALLTSSSSAQEPGRKFALLVSVDKYPSDSLLSSLKFPERDIEAFAKVLLDSGYEARDVVVLSRSRGNDDPALFPMADNIRRRLELVLAQCREPDSVVIALAGHGAMLAVERQQDGQAVTREESVFCPLDADLRTRRLDRFVSLDELCRQLAEAPARTKILICDACRNDAFAGGRPAGITLPPPIAPPATVAALFSCAKQQVAHEDERLNGGHGVFFHFLIEGLSGKADKDDDQQVTLTELADYTQLQVRKYVADRFGTLQTPELHGSIHRTPLASLERKPKVAGQGYLGVRWYWPADVLKMFGAVLGSRRRASEELMVLGAVPGSPAVKGGLQTGDRIIEFDGRPLRNRAEFDQALARKFVGDEVTLVCERKERLFRATVRLTEPPANLLQELEKAAEAGTPWVLHELASIYGQGQEGAPRDSDREQDFLERAAVSGLSVSQTILGAALLRDPDPTQQARGVELLRTASDAGEVLATLLLAGYYGETDPKRGFTIAHAAAERTGAPALQMIVAMQYLRGIGVEHDPAAAVHWLRLAADEGVPGAQYTLGTCYLTGLGVAQDRATAIDWLAKAAQNDVPDAQRSMGELSIENKSYGTAAAWFRKAADRDDQKAQFELAQLYENGQGVPQDRSEAIRWYRKAAAQGHEEAKKKLQALGADP